MRRLECSEWTLSSISRSKPFPQSTSSWSPIIRTSLKLLDGSISKGQETSCIPKASSFKLTDEAVQCPHPASKWSMNPMDLQQSCWLKGTITRCARTYEIYMMNSIHGRAFGSTNYKQS